MARISGIPRCEKQRPHGHESYDLRGIAPPNQPDQAWQISSAFKANFGGEKVHLAPTLDLVFDAAAYDQYMAIENSFWLVENRGFALKGEY